MVLYDHSVTAPRYTRCIKTSQQQNDPCNDWIFFYNQQFSCELNLRMFVHTHQEIGISIERIEEKGNIFKRG